jgi:hypothetical protein
LANCLIYGNCQTVALTKILYSALSKKYIIHNIKAVHKLTKNDIDYIYEIIGTIDLLIIQPISDNYKNNFKLSTKSILQNVKPECKIIIFPICYFNFYYPNVTYLKTQFEEYCEYYHDINLINLYKKTQNMDEIISEYIDIVNNIDLPFNIDPLIAAELSLKELEKRQKDMLIYGQTVINISEFISKNFKSQLLFYTRNHPTKYLFSYLAISICEIIKMDYIFDNTIDPLYNKHPPLYKSLQKYVNFDTSFFIPLLYDTSGLYNIAKKLLLTLQEKKFIIK